MKNARNFVLENIMPKDILCYHVKLFEVILIDIIYNHIQLIALHVQCSPVIKLCLESIGMDSVISELCYIKGQFYKES